MNGHPSYIFQSAVRILFFLINLFAIYIMLRGHNLPGGGFIGGLITAISLILLRLAMGLPAALRIIRVDPVRIAAGGLLLGALTAIAPMLFGYTFFQHFMWHLHHVPLLGEVHVGTPLFFDLGVYFVVVGITSKIIFVLGKSAQGYPALEPAEEMLYRARGELPIEEPAETAPAATSGKEDRRAD